MARRDHKIKQWRSNDKAALREVALCGHGTMADFRRHGISERRVKDMTRKNCGVLEKFEVMHKGQVGWAYRFTDRGKKFARDKLDIEYAMRSQTSSFAHNQKLREVLQERQDDPDIKRIWTERDLLHEYKDEITELQSQDVQVSAVDSMIEYADGSCVCLEITTRNYTKEMIAAKDVFVTKILKRQASLEFHSVEKKRGDQS